MIIRQNLKQKLTNSKDVAILLGKILQKEHRIDRDKEHFWVIGRNSNGSTRYIELVSLGGLRVAHVEPRETFRLAIMKAVDSIICVHNHPSGEAEPSSQDKQITDQLTKAGKIIGITLLDHLIIGKKEFYSIRTECREKF